MNQQMVYKWLAVAALVEWLLVRTLTRAAIHVPKSPLVIAVYTAVNRIGLVSAAFVALLAVVLLLWLAWRTRQAIILPIALVGLVGLSTLFLFIVPPMWVALTYQLFAIVAVILLIVGHRYGQEVAEPEKKRKWQGTAVVLFPACALLSGLIVQLLPNLYRLLGWPGPPSFSTFLFNVGESFVVGSVMVWWWEYGRSRSRRHWLIATVLALFFALSFWRDPAMTGILTIWSIGLTLFLPWPVYVLTLWLVAVTVLANWQMQPTLAWAILLLATAGYAPQLSSQLFCALIALWLLGQPFAMTQIHAVHHRQPDSFRTEPQLITDN